MPQHLRVKVVRLEARVVHVHLGTLEEEEAVVVDEVGPAVQPEEDRLVDARRVVHELRREEVEVRRVEVVARREVGYAHAKVAELVDGGGALLEALELVGAAVFFGGLLGGRGSVVGLGAGKGGGGGGGVRS